MESHDEKIYMLIVEGQRGGANANDYFEQAIELIVQYYTERIIRYLSGRLPSSEVEVIAQEAIISVYESLQTYPGDADTLELWILRITYNKHCDYYRSNNSLGRSKGLWNPSDDIQMPNLEETLEDVDATQLKKNLFDYALSKLPLRYRVVIKLRLLENLSPKQVAWVLDTSIGNIRTVHRRAIQKLKKEVRKLEREGRDHAC